MYSFDANGKCVVSVYSPYGKLYGIPVSSISSFTEQKELQENVYVPYILLESVDRSVKTMRLSPIPIIMPH